MPIKRTRRRSALRALFGLVGLTFLVVALRDSWLRGEVDFPSMGVAVIGVLLVVLGLVAAGLSWAVLFESRQARPALAASFLVSLVARYAPAGGVSQAIGQITLATSDEVSPGNAGAKFLVHAGIQVVVAGTLAGFLVFDASQPAAVRVLLGCALLTPLLLTPRWMLPLLRGAARLAGRPTPSAGTLPSRGRMMISAGLSFLPALGGAVVYAIVLRELDSTTSIMRTALAFSAAWVAGYVALPFPAGIGVREAVLVGLLPAPAAVVTAASIVHRLLTMLAELIVVPIAWWRAR